MKKYFLLSTFIAISTFTANAQSPIPVIVPAMTPAAAEPANPVPPAQNSETLQNAIKMLEAMKAANEEILKKQEATLIQLDDLEKAAEQLKIFSKRG